MSAPIVVDRDALAKAIAQPDAPGGVFMADHLIASGTVKTLADALRELADDYDACRAVGRPNTSRRTILALARYLETRADA